jgi:hypothetical protein
MRRLITRSCLLMMMMMMTMIMVFKWWSSIVLRIRGSTLDSVPSSRYISLSCAQLWFTELLFSSLAFYTLQQLLCRRYIMLLCYCTPKVKSHITKKQRESNDAIASEYCKARVLLEPTHITCLRRRRHLPRLVMVSFDFHKIHWIHSSYAHILIAGDN